MEASRARPRNKAVESGRKQKTMALLRRYRATNRPRATRSPLLSGFLAGPLIVGVLAVTRLSHLFLAAAAASLSRRRRGLEKESGEARALIPRPPLPPAPARGTLSLRRRRHLVAPAPANTKWPQPPEPLLHSAERCGALSLFLITETTLCEVSRGFWGERQDEIWLHLSEIIVLWDLSTVWERSPQTPHCQWAHSSLCRSVADNWGHLCSWQVPSDHKQFCRSHFWLTFLVNRVSSQN